MCLHTFLNFEWERDSETWTLERTSNAALQTSVKSKNVCLHNCSNTISVPKQKQQDNRDTETPFSGSWRYWMTSCVTSVYIAEANSTRKTALGGKHPELYKLHSCNCQAHCQTRQCCTKPANSLVTANSSNCWYYSCFQLVSQVPHYLEARRPAQQPLLTQIRGVAWRSHTRC